MKAKRTSPFVSRVFIIAGMAILCALKPAAAESSKHSKTKPAGRSQLLSLCKSPAGKAGQPAQSAISTHTVILSWNASAAPSSSHGKADGYCLYRSLRQGDAVLEEKCKECELLNRTPLPGTACIDNTLADGPTYFYAVAAVDAAGMSAPSNETSASTRATKAASGAQKDIPLCNGTSSVEKSDKANKP